MPVNVKLAYQDVVAVVPEATRGEEKAGDLLLYDKDNKVVARFTSSKVEHWWPGSTEASEEF